MSLPTFRPLGFGEILDGAFTLYRRNLVPFLVTAFIPSVAIVAMLAWLGSDVFGAMDSSDPTVFLSVMGTMLLLVAGIGVVYLVAWAALVREASQAYLGQPASVGDGMRVALRKLPTMLLAVVVILIGLFAAYIAVAIVFGVIIALGASSGSAAGTVGLTLVAGLVAAAAYLLVIATLFAVLPAILVEDKGPVQAIARSFDLARGALWRTVGLMLVALLITWLPGLAVMAVTGGFANLAHPEAVSSGRFLAQQVLGWGVNVLTTPFMVAVVVLLYFDRRVRTEALDVQMAADRVAAAS